MLRRVSASEQDARAQLNSSAARASQVRPRSHRHAPIAKLLVHNFQLSARLMPHVFTSPYDMNSFAALNSRRSAVTVALHLLAPSKTDAIKGSFALA